MVDLPRAHFEAVLRHLPAGVVIEEAPSGRPVLGNEQLAAIWGHPFSSIDDVDWFMALRAFHPGGRPYRPSEWPSTRVLSTGRPVEGQEMEIERLDGSRATVRASSAPIRDNDGTIVAVVSTYYDITEQKKQELARRFLSKASSILAKSLDYETTLRNVARLVIPALADWCAIDILRADGRIDRLAVEHFRPEKARLAREVARRYPADPDARVGVARVLRTGQAELIPDVTDEVLASLAHDAEHLRILRSAGMRSAMVLPLRARGRALGAIVFVMAESGRRYTEADLDLADDLALRAALAIDNARLYHESEAANRAKSDFLAVVSHELRTPLTAVIGYAELLGLGVPDPLTERQRDQVERIGISASHLLMLIEEILTMISLETREVALDPADVELGELLHRAEVIMRPITDAKGLTLDVDTSDATLFTDGERLLQVMLNLLSNAVKFTDAGGVRIEVTEAEDFVELAVADTGVGLTLEQQERIFEPFWQAEHPITRRAGGTGLGLTITMGLVRRLGGTLRVESELSVGSVFTARIPRQLPEPGRRPPARGAAARSPVRPRI